MGRNPGKLYPACATHPTPEDGPTEVIEVTPVLWHACLLAHPGYSLPGRDCRRGFIDIFQSHQHFGLRP